MNKQHGLLFKMLCICLATVLMAGSMATVSFAHDGDHAYDGWKPNTDGTHTGYCTIPNCDATKTEKHTFTEWTSDGDATHTRSCTACGTTETQSHKFTWTDNKDGTHTGICTVCNYKIENKPHAYTWQASSNGETCEKICVCGKIEESKNHDFGEWVIGETHVRTCKTCEYKEVHRPQVTRLEADKIKEKTNENEHTVICAICKNEFTEYHYFYKGRRVDPTCTTNGYFERTCRCGYVTEEPDNAHQYKYLAKLGHDYKWVVTKNRTLFEAGEKTWTCWRCGETTDSVKTEIIPSIMEDIGAWIVGAFGFAGHVVYEPIRWIVKLFYNPVEKDA
jgi:hypothetical protein